MFQKFLFILKTLGVFFIGGTAVGCAIRTFCWIAGFHNPNPVPIVLSEVTAGFIMTLIWIVINADSI